MITDQSIQIGMERFTLHVLAGPDGYRHQGTAVQLFLMNGDPYATVSVWLPPSPRLPASCFFADINNAADLVDALAQAGLIEWVATIPPERSGYVAYRAYRLLPPHWPLQLDRQAAEVELRRRAAAIPGAELTLVESPLSAMVRHAAPGRADAEEMSALRDWALNAGILFQIAEPDPLG